MQGDAMSTHSDAPACGRVPEADRAGVGGQTLYGSPAWLAILREEARALLRAAPKTHAAFSLVEIFLDAPIEVRPRAGLPGYRMDFRDGTITFRTSVTAEETADLIVHIDWQAGIQLASMKNGPELSRASEHFTRAGKFKVTGTSAACPIPLQELHDRIVARTVAA